MPADYNAENAKATERLRRFAAKATDAELKTVIYKEGWTVAVALAHLAFWDERRRIVLRQWREKGVEITGYILDIVNDAMIPLLLAIPPKQAAALAVTTAEALDKEIAALPPDMLKSIQALNEPMVLDRARHRNMHLDEIEVFLKAQKK